MDIVAGGAVRIASAVPSDLGRAASSLQVPLVPDDHDAGGSQSVLLNHLQSTGLAETNRLPYQASSEELFSPKSVQRARLYSVLLNTGFMQRSLSTAADTLLHSAPARTDPADPQSSCRTEGMLYAPPDLDVAPGFFASALRRPT